MVSARRMNRINRASRKRAIYADSRKFKKEDQELQKALKLLKRGRKRAYSATLPNHKSGVTKDSLKFDKEDQKIQEELKELKGDMASARRMQHKEKGSDFNSSEIYENLAENGPSDSLQFE